MWSYECYDELLPLDVWSVYEYQWYHKHRGVAKLDQQCKENSRLAHNLTIIIEINEDTFFCYWKIFKYSLQCFLLTTIDYTKPEKYQDIKYQKWTGDDERMKLSCIIFIDASVH